jgi:hypothetical protein
MNETGLAFLCLSTIFFTIDVSAQVIYGGVTYPLTLTTSGVNSYGQTGPLPRYSFQRYPDVYWYYIADLGFGQRFVFSKTAVPYLTNDPP